jgi:AraC-like DNA-binding protein
MHQEPAQAWTVAALARLAGMSRSSFAARFVQTVGTSPIGYLLDWRMNLAKAALRSSKQPMSVIAARIGYQSVSAFSRATGVAPTAYMRPPT